MRSTAKEKKLLVWSNFCQDLKSLFPFRREAKMKMAELFSLKIRELHDLRMKHRFVKVALFHCLNFR